MAEKSIHDILTTREHCNLESWVTGFNNFVNHIAIYFSISLLIYPVLIIYTV